MLRRTSTPCCSMKSGVFNCQQSRSSVQIPVEWSRYLVFSRSLVLMQPIAPHGPSVAGKCRIRSPESVSFELPTMDVGKDIGAELNDRFVSRPRFRLRKINTADRWIAFVLLQTLGFLGMESPVKIQIDSAGVTAIKPFCSCIDVVNWNELSQADLQ